MATATQMLILCGAQITSVPAARLSELHKVLTRHPKLWRKLGRDIENLPQLFSQIVQGDDGLVDMQAREGLQPLLDWIVSGNVRNSVDASVNHASLVWTVLLQLCMYIEYLDTVTAHGQARELYPRLQKHGVAGFCAGFLTASAIALSEDEDTLATHAMTSIRLAMCIGIYVDADIASVPGENTVCVLSARWKPGITTAEEVFSIVEGYDDAYISCITDQHCVTITLLSNTRDQLVRELEGCGVRARDTGITGRFHCSRLHQATVRAAHKLIDTIPSLQLPTAQHLKVPLRSSIDGRIIIHNNESLAKTAINAILLQTADWYSTVRMSKDSGDFAHGVVTLSFDDYLVPLSIIQQDGLDDADKPNHASDSTCQDGDQATGRLENSHKAQPNSMNGHAKVDGSSRGHDVLSDYPAHSIAVIGMSGRFPGANDLEEFWNLLRRGEIMIREPPQCRLNLYNDRLPERCDVKFWGNFIDDPDAFDHRFFKKSSREAISWDPEKRVLLEVVYEALESAGHFGPGRSSGSIDYGCFIGAVANNYYDNVAGHAPNAYSMLGTSRAFFSGRIAHQFGLTGPAMTIDTACSSSLVAINAACRAIQARECNGAIAGGTNIFTSPYDYQNLAAAGFLSPSGACKPFDAAANGYARGEGVAAVVLKSLSKAVEEGDHILGVIVGSAVNQNLNDAHITVPCSSSQRTAYEKALSMADVTPSAVTYVEAHGTGTQVGDPIEFQSIRQAFGSPSRSKRLYVGSVKGNIGHTEATAGVAGLIKVLLMMKYRMILPQAGFATLNPKIPALEPDLMEIPTTCVPWIGETRLACVNSYGAAGSNAVIAIRDCHLQSTNMHQLLEFPQLLFLSAASEGSLRAYATKLIDKLAALRLGLNNTRHLLPSFLFQVSVRGNHELPFYVAKRVKSLEDLERSLKAVSSGSEIPKIERTSPAPSVILVFGGQEQTSIGLASGVVCHSAIFSKHLEQCESEAAAFGVDNLTSAIHRTSSIPHLPTLHAALFAVQYASAKTWMECGVTINAVVGHSFGQMTALCISGCLCLKDTMSLVVGRARLIETLWGSERGAMLSVQGDLPRIKDLLEGLRSQDPETSLEIACYNHAKSHVLVGRKTAIDLAETLLLSDSQMRAKRLSVTHGFHSVLCEPLLPSLHELANSVKWAQPQVHIELALEYAAPQQPGPWLIADLIRKPVYFGTAISRLSKKYNSAVWLEAGPGSSVMSLVKQSISSVNGESCLRSQLNTSRALESVADTVIQLWKCGMSVQFWPYHRRQRSDYEHIDLPPYQFEKTKHWLPFVERSTTKENLPTQVDEAKHEFISLSDSTADMATFLVDPESDRFVYLVSGHTVAGQCLTPSSLYIELLSRATLLLTKDATYNTHVMNVDRMEIKGSPIGLDPKKNIYIQLKRIMTRADYWDFVILTKNKTGGHDSVVHTTGKVGLKRRDDPFLKEVTQRWSALIGYERCLRLIASEDTEKMQGKHVYTALRALANFSEMYHGIKSISYQGKEAAGKAASKLSSGLSPSEALYDTPTIDGLMQFTGVLVNYFAHPSGDDVLVCQGINEIVTGGAFDITLGEWVVYTIMTEDTPERIVSDVYVFDPNTKQVVIAFMGFVFIRVGMSVLNRSLHYANHGQIETKRLPRAALTSSVPSIAGTIPGPVVNTPSIYPHASDMPTSTGLSRQNRVIQILHQITDVPLDKIVPEVTLEDLGIDSLLVTEVLREIQGGLGISIDLNDFLCLPDVGAICQHIDAALGTDDAPATMISMASSTTSAVSPSPLAANSVKCVSQPSVLPVLYRARATFAQCRDAYSRAAVTTGAAGFWEKCYPDEAALVLGYVVEAFVKLGVNLAAIAEGQAVAVVPHLQRHEKLVRQLYRVLEDASLVSVNEMDQFIRTSKAVNSVPASELYDKIIPSWPKHASVHKIVRAVGSELGPCLMGQKDALQIVFGDKENKKTLEDLYENWPLVRSATLALGEFLEKLFNEVPQGGTYRILEVGAGTGGTTKYIVRHLQRLRVPFEYIFTDLSASLVGAAKRTFDDCAEMRFCTLDIEKEPEPSWINCFHLIISTNCIHATRDLTRSLKSLRKMLRHDGVLTLVEMTQNIFWQDIAVGLFEGWWLFEDGREHAIAHESRWKRCMEAAGFAATDWTDGADREAQTVRVIAGFASD